MEYVCVSVVQVKKNEKSRLPDVAVLLDKQFLMTHQSISKDLNLQQHIRKNVRSHNKITPFRDKNYSLNKTTTVEGTSQVETPSDGRISRKIGDTCVLEFRIFQIL
jgi:hypothetical protein